MHVSPGLHIEWVDEEAVVLNETTKELHHLSPSAALVLALIEEKGFATAMAELEDRFGEVASFNDDLKELLAELGEKGILSDG